MKKLYGLTILLTILLTVLLMVYMYREWTLLDFVDAASIASLVLAIIGGSLYVSGGGFFTGVAYSFRRFFKKTSPVWQLLEEGDDHDYYPKTRSFPIKNPLLVTASLQFVVTLGISILYFV